MALSFSFTMVDESELPVVDRESGVATFGLTQTGAGSAYALPGALDFKAGTNSVLIASKVKQVLSTQAFGTGSQGELPWRPEFGASISTLRFASLKDSLPAVVSTYVKEALERWVPEVTLRNVGVKSDAKLGILTVRVIYTENDSKKTVAATITAG